MKTHDIRMPVIFRNPFQNLPKGWTTHIWVSLFRKRNGMPVIVDWTAKAFRRHVPPDDRRRILRNIPHGITYCSVDGPPWKVIAHSPVKEQVYTKGGLPHGVKPIRRLRGVLTPNRLIPGWALDADPAQVKTEYLRVSRNQHAKNLFCMPDASDKNFVHVFKRMAASLAARSIDNRCAFNNDNCVVCINPALEFKRPLIESLVHRQEYEHINGEVRLYRVIPKILEKVS